MNKLDAARKLANSMKRSSNYSIAGVMQRLGERVRGFHQVF